MFVSSNHKIVGRVERADLGVRLEARKWRRINFHALGVQKSTVVEQVVRAWILDEGREPIS